MGGEDVSILDTFDPEGEEIVQAKNTVSQIANFPATMLVVFSEKFCELFLSRYQASKIGELPPACWRS